MVVGTYEPRRTHPLYRDVLTDANFTSCDRDLADTARDGGCNGVVHSAHYWRRPRGRPCRLGREHDRRFSLCCAVDGYRSRATPPSLRFLGSKAIVVLIAVLRHGATALRMRELSTREGRRRPPEPQGRAPPAQGAGRRRATGSSATTGPS
jgi:hypothetical protein